MFTLCVTEVSFLAIIVSFCFYYLCHTPSRTILVGHGLACIFTACLKTFIIFVGFPKCGNRQIVRPCDIHINVIYRSTLSLQNKSYLIFRDKIFWSPKCWASPDILLFQTDLHYYFDNNSVMVNQQKQCRRKF